MNDTTSTNTTVQIGDVLCSSWGYDQTNCDFYQVTGLTAKGVKVRPINGHEVDKGMMTGETTPIKDSFCGPEEYHKLKGDWFRVNSYSGASKTEWNKAHYCSHTH